MEIEQPEGIGTPVFVAGGQLLKYIHVAKLQVVVGIGVVGKTCEKPVLIEVIVHDVLPKLMCTSSLSTSENVLGAKGVLLNGMAIKKLYRSYQLKL